MKTEEVLGHRDLRKVCSIKKMKRTAKKEKKKSICRAEWNCREIVLGANWKQ